MREKGTVVFFFLLSFVFIVRHGKRKRKKKKKKKKKKRSEFSARTYLLAFHQPRRSINADNEVPGDLGIECTTMSRFLTAHDPLDPRDNFMRARITRLIKVDDTVLQVLLERSLERAVSSRDGRVVTTPHMQFIVCLEQQRPV